MTTNITETQKGAASYGVLANSTIEEELFALRSLDPEKMADLPIVFKEAVLSSINSIMDKRNAQVLLAMLRGVNLGDQDAVLAALDELGLRHGALLKKAISMEFKARVHAIVKNSVGSRASVAELAARTDSLFTRLGV